MEEAGFDLEATAFHADGLRNEFGGRTTFPAAVVGIPFGGVEGGAFEFVRVGLVEHPVVALWSGRRRADEALERNGKQWGKECEG